MPLPTRRDLVRMAAASAAARLVPSVLAQEPRTVGYCVVGLGRIASHFMEGSRLSRYTRITGLVSGHRDKAEKLAAQYNVPTRSIYGYENYDAIADNKAIDAVIVCLPNSMHAEYTIRAARAGKHVLCEKPMCTTVAEGEAMIEACRRAGRKLMIAYRCHYEPLNLKAVQWLREGRLGTIHTIESAFGFDSAPGEWRLTRTLGGGGPLMDVGIYCLNACRYLAGEEPVEVKGSMSVVDAADPRFQEVEEDLVWSMKFPSGALATCQTSYGVAMPGYFHVRGSKGTLHMDPAFNYDGLRFSARIDGQAPVEEASQYSDPAHFVLETDHLAECILRDKTPKSPGEEGLRDMRLMMEIYKSCGRA
jgi:predicted dehydrogenase